MACVISFHLREVLSYGVPLVNDSAKLVWDCFLLLAPEVDGTPDVERICWLSLYSLTCFTFRWSNKLLVLPWLTVTFAWHSLQITFFCSVSLCKPEPSPYHWCRVPPPAARDWFVGFLYQHAYLSPCFSSYIRLCAASQLFSHPGTLHVRLTTPTNLNFTVYTG